MFLLGRLLIWLAGFSAQYPTVQYNHHWQAAGFSTKTSSETLANVLYPLFIISFRWYSTLLYLLPVSEAGFMLLALLLSANLKITEGTFRNWISHVSVKWLERIYL